jgi:hypothetical protein
MRTPVSSWLPPQSCTTRVKGRVFSDITETPISQATLLALCLVAGTIAFHLSPTLRHDYLLNDSTVVPKPTHANQYP